MTGSTIDQKTFDPADIQEVQDQDCPYSQEPATTFGSNIGQFVVSELRLIPFEQKKGEEVLDFSTIFYDREKKRIVSRTKKMVEIGGQSGMMVTDKTLVHGTNKDPRLTVKAGAALIHATEDNVDRLMIDLEQ